MSDSGTPALSFLEVTVRYQDGAGDALHRVSFDHPAAAMVAVLGRTGAGKSTLLKCANRIVPDLQNADVAGRIALFGRDLDDVRVADLAGEVGFVFQDFEAQLFSTSALEELVFGLEQIGVPPAEMEERARSALDAVGLVGFERRDPTTLSGGEKQRLAIASLLAARPRLLLLDEPSTDLDPAGRREILSLLGLLRDAGTTLLVAEHDTDSLPTPDHVLVLADGELALRGTAEQVLGRPDELSRLGVRPPELALLASSLGLATWPIDLDAVESRIRRAGLLPRPRPHPAVPVPGEVLIETRGLGHRYPGSATDALRSVDLELRRGERVALIGANGSGKSTLARLLDGLLEPTRGSVAWRGRPIRGLEAAERARAVGYVFQNPDDQIFAATVEEEVSFGPLRLGCSAAEVSRRVAAALAAVGLDRDDRRDPFLLGKGERQRLAVASILALEPEVLILDEPTTGLDGSEQRELLGVLERLNAAGTTVVLVTHVPWVVAAFARRALLLASGEVLWDGPVRELLAREEVCRRADFLPPEAARLARRLGSSATTVDELLAEIT
jgi:energy-coupling factor transport system ATP-binding protein